MAKIVEGSGQSLVQRITQESAWSTWVKPNKHLAYPMPQPRLEQDTYENVESATVWAS